MRNVAEYAVPVTIHFPLASCGLASFMLIAMKKLNVFQVGYAISHCSGMMDDDFFYILPQGNGYETVNPAISTSAIGICLIRHSYIRNCQSKACQGKIYVKEQK